MAGTAAGIGGASFAAFSSVTSTPANTFSAASSFCTAAPSTVTANLDTWVDEWNGNAQYGSETTLVTRSWRVGGGSHRNGRTLVRFPLPAVPSGCALATATLRMTTATDGAAGRTIEVLRAASEWTEATTWNTQPATAGTAATATSVASGTFTVDVTAQAQALYADANNGFVLRDAEEGTQGSSPTQTWHSREAAAGRPTLEITWG